MSTTTIRLQVPQSAEAPRAAARLAELTASAIGFLASLLPEPAATRYPSREAARVRALAHRQEASDPRFASELYAAADRYEAMNDR